MMLWIMLVVITVATLALVLSPLLRKRSLEARRVDYDVVVYRDQLAELDKEIARGLLSPDQAEAARAEIYRRMLVSEDAEASVSAAGEGSGPSLRSKIVAALVVLIVLPTGAGVTYALLGSPELPGKPYASRQNDSEFVMATEAEKLAAQLESNPDAAGYKRLADTYFALRRYDEAIETYRKLIQMSGGSAILWSELGEAIALSQDDLVVPEARQSFVKALRLDPHDARARFYLGLSETQIGEPRRAVAIWRDLEKDGPADAQWMPMVKEHITAFAKDAGFDPETVAPAPPSLNSPHDGMITTQSPEPSGGAPSSTKAAPSIKPNTPTRDAASAIMAMKPDDQDAVIHKMVDRLDAKMKANPDDLDGWLRLANAYRVLGETDKAKAAESKADALKAKGAVVSDKPVSNEMAPPSGDADAAKAIMALPAADQNAQIHKMVDGLAAKLQAQPDNLNGWQLLATSYRVLGETDKAQAAENKVAALKAKATGKAVGP
jgi:cytochrome c-type biogenesis protein CcmH